VLTILKAVECVILIISVIIFCQFQELLVVFWYFVWLVHGTLALRVARLVSWHIRLTAGPDHGFSGP